MLVRVLYVSVVAQGVTAWDIEQLVVNCRRRNRQLDLTGALAVCALRFAQVIEGREEVVNDMLAKIEKDARHCGMQVIDRSFVERRLCDGWEMAFLDEPSWAAVLDDVSSGALAPQDFYRIILDRIEDKRGPLLALTRLEGSPPARRS